MTRLLPLPRELMALHVRRNQRPAHCPGLQSKRSKTVWTRRLELVRVPCAFLNPHMQSKLICNARTHAGSLGKRKEPASLGASQSSLASSPGLGSAPVRIKKEKFMEQQIDSGLSEKLPRVRLVKPEVIEDGRAVGAAMGRLQQDINARDELDVKIKAEPGLQVPEIKPEERLAQTTVSTHHAVQWQVTVVTVVMDNGLTEWCPPAACPCACAA